MVKHWILAMPVPYRLLLLYLRAFNKNDNYFIRLP